MESPKVSSFITPKLKAKRPSTARLTVPIGELFNNYSSYQSWSCRLSRQLKRKNIFFLKMEDFLHSEGYREVLCRFERAFFPRSADFSRLFEERNANGELSSERALVRLESAPESVDRRTTAEKKKPDKNNKKTSIRNRISAPLWSDRWRRTRVTKIFNFEYLKNQFESSIFKQICNSESLAQD